MSEKKQTQKLVQVKLALAKKYESLARISKSRPRQKTLLRHARSYRQQAEDLTKRAS